MQQDLNKRQQCSKLYHSEQNHPAEYKDSFLLSSCALHSALLRVVLTDMISVTVFVFVSVIFHYILVMAEKTLKRCKIENSKTNMTFKKKTYLSFSLRPELLQ